MVVEIKMRIPHSLKSKQDDEKWRRIKLVGEKFVVNDADDLVRIDSAQHIYIEFDYPVQAEQILNK